MKTFLNVPYSEKEEAKRLGAKWDIARKKWFVENVNNLTPFLKWMDEHLTQPFEPIYPPVIPPKHKRPDNKKPGKKANKERLRKEREALRNKNVDQPNREK